MENKQKHLEFIQNAINRMANNSFIIKGWCVTIISVLFTLSEKENNPSFIIILLLPIISFWLLDAYFLKLEREYRKLYDEVRIKENIDFCMNTEKVRVCITDTFFSKSIFAFYFLLIIINIVIYLVDKKF